MAIKPNTPPSERLIWDRTVKDIQPETRTAKGYMNASDWKRINDWINYLCTEQGIEIQPVVFADGDAITRAKMEQLIANVETIKQEMDLTDYTPTAPIPVAWDWRKENLFETIINVLWHFYYSPYIDKLYSGTFRAGHNVKFRGGLGL